MILIGDGKIEIKTDKQILREAAEIVKGIPYRWRFYLCNICTQTFLSLHDLDAHTTELHR